MKANSKRRKHRRALRKAALRYARKGWPVFPLRGKEQPLIKDNLARASTNPKQIAEWWDTWPDANIGLVCGDSVIVIDADRPKGNEVAPDKLLDGWDLPATKEAITGSGHRHRYFTAPKSTPINRLVRRFRRGKKKVALDILGTGGYVVAPPSIHPDTGKKYRWVDWRVKARRLPRAVVDAIAKVQKQGDKILAAAPLPSLIYEGERDSLLTSLAGSMRRRNASPQAILEALRVENDVRVRPPVSDGQLRKIANSIGKKRPADSDVAYLELNRRYAVVTMAPKVMVLAEAEPPSRSYELLSVEAFHHLHANNFVDVDHGDGHKKRVPTSKGWFTWEGRREYERLVFKPGDEHVPHSEFNVWRGWAVRPSESGSCDRFLKHLRDVVCRGEPEHYEWLLDWMADLFQNPQRKPGSAVVLRGRQGTGKSIVGDVLGQLLGPHRIAVDKAELITGRFNAHLERCLLLQAEEAFWSGDHRAEAVLKHLVTGTTQQIERKGVDAVEMPNYMRLLITSNAEWVWPASLDDRRAFITEVKDSHQNDKKYFRRLFAELERGGYGTLLHTLLTRSIDQKRLGIPPTTKTLQQQAVHTLAPDVQWLHELLLHGRLPSCTIDAKGRAHVPVGALYDSYCQTVSKGRFRKSAPQFGLFLNDHLPRVKGVKYAGPWRYVGSNGVTQSRPRVIPSLSECRARYSARGRAAPQNWPKPSHHWRSEE